MTAWGGYDLACLVRSVCKHGTDLTGLVYLVPLERVRISALV